MLTIRELSDGTFLIELEYAVSDEIVSLHFSGIFARIGDITDRESLDVMPNGVNIRIIL